MPRCTCRTIRHGECWDKGKKEVLDGPSSASLQLLQANLFPFSSEHRYLALEPFRSFVSDTLFCCLLLIPIPYLC